MGIKIIGICLVKNEDIYIENVLKNISNFCDKIRVIDNGSEDNTVDIVKKCIEKYPNISLEYIKDVDKTHNLVERYAGEKKWVFGVDGDEIYDPKGLSYLRSKILSGKYQKLWMLRGYFFHLVDLNMKTKEAYGYLAPPAKDPNKLYNFRLLKSWLSDSKQPLFHCQTHVFKDKEYYSQHYPQKKFLHNKSNWENCSLRCVHTRMLKRSSKEDFDTSINARLNLSNVMDNSEHNFRKKYRKGKRVKKDVKEFLI